MVGLRLHGHAILPIATAHLILTQARSPASGGQTAVEAAERSRKAIGDPMPYLGGSAYQRLDHDGKTYLCGTRGLVIQSSCAGRSGSNREANLISGQR